MATEKKDKLTLKKYRKQMDKLEDMLVEANNYFMESNISMTDYIGILETMKANVIKYAFDRAKMSALEAMVSEAFGGDEDAD